MAKAKFNLMEALKDKGFERIENPMEMFGSKAEYYEKVWTRTTKFARGGEYTSTFRVVAIYVPSFNGNKKLDCITFKYSNGKVKQHMCDKRAWNALKATVEYNGHEF